jgi:hypothetical protein
MKAFRRAPVTLLFIGFSLSLLLPSEANANSVQSTSPIANQQMEQLLSLTGYPVGRVDGYLDDESRRGLCLWRDYSGLNVSRKMPSVHERFLLSTVTRPKVPSRLVTGLNISRSCQTVTWVSFSNLKQIRYVKAIYKASTGKSGFETRTGLFQIYLQFDKWIESGLYPGAMMYRPKFFSGGQAMHGSWTDSLVLPYPASHGCVRMLHSAIDYMWSHGIGIGTKVLVYGDWHG